MSRDAKGFDDLRKPKIAVWIWAQTRDDAPGKQEPEWGKEQPNISFNHIFKGIDIDVRGHAGAIGIRHSGSQGSTLQDCTIHAEGAYAGMSNYCGQGGGTHNIEVLGGQYGIIIDRSSRFLNRIADIYYTCIVGEHTLRYYHNAAGSKYCIGIHRCTVRDYQPWNPQYHRRGLLKADETPYSYTQRTNRKVYEMVYPLSTKNPK